MTIFWILAAGLLLLAALFVAAPLLGNRHKDADDTDVDQARINLELFKQQLAELDADLAAGKLDRAQYESARHDLERELLRDIADFGTADTKPAADTKLTGARLTGVALLFAVPATAVVLYLMLGNLTIIPQLEQVPVTSQAAQHAGAAGTQSLDMLVQRLEERLQQTPDDGQGWTMLGRTYFATGRTQDAERALARAHELLPNDVQVTLAYAESIAANNDRNLQGKPAELIAEVLKAQPDDATARWLSGMVDFQRGQFQAAAKTWKQVLAQVDPASDDATELRSLIVQAQERAGIPPDQRLAAGGNPTPPEQPAVGAASPPRSSPAQPATGAETPAPGAQRAPQAATAAALDVTVSMAPDLAGRMPPDTTVFVFARAASGPPMPLAVQRLKVSDLPTTVRLDDSMAMMPQMRLSAFPQVVVGARVSPSGQAMPQSGDLEGDTGPISSTDTGSISVTIDHVRQ